MRIHHINCGILAMPGGRLVDGYSRGRRAKLVCHCWLVETSRGLVLVDTGFGTSDVRTPVPRLSPLLLKVNGVRMNPALTARSQVERLGFQVSDVRHIVLTHLDFDHAGGLADFPEAEIHVMSQELEQARGARTWLDRRRYRRAQWGPNPRWNTYTSGGEPWFGFEAVRALKGLPPEILMVPLAGHTAGHAGIAVQTREGWMLHAGDAYFYRRELEPKRYCCTLGLRLYQMFMQTSRHERWQNIYRLRELVAQHSDHVRICSSHDAIELTAYQAAQIPLHRHYSQAAPRSHERLDVNPLA